MSSTTYCVRALCLCRDLQCMGAPHTIDEPIMNVCVFACLCRYGCYLYFQLCTHHDLFCGDDEDEEPVMTFPGALAVLAGITAAVAVCSE